ncbi:MAG: TolC family protein [Terrimicrobiaceae bacterium]|nr:TolC family protein [Terrimicrobiaceae bacterium]
MATKARLAATLIAALLGANHFAGATSVTRTLDLTYRTAIERALAKNFQIQVETYNPKIAKAHTLSETGTFDPTVGLSYTYDENRRDLSALNPTFDSGVPGSGGTGRFANTSGAAANATISGLTTWGMNYSFGPTFTRNTNSNSPINESYDTFLGGSITQPLLKNFGTDVNLAQVRIARVDQSITAWGLRQRVIDVVTDVVRVYNDLYFSIQNLEVERRSRDLARQTLHDNERRAEIGVMTDLDIVQAQADVADREGRVLVAERTVADNENFLKQLVTDDATELLFVTVRIAPPPFDLAANVDEPADLKHAFDLRPDYQQALLDIQKRNINVVFNRNQTLPQLDLVASLGLNGLDTSAGGSVSELTTPSNLAATAGAVFSLPVPNRTARGNLEVARLEVARQLVALKQLEQSITVEVDNAAGQIATTRKLIDSTKAGRFFAERTLEAAQARLAAGKATTFEVLQFQRDLATAETNEVLALTGYQKAIANYARVTGTTLERNRLRLE